MDGDFITHSLFWKMMGAMGTAFTFVTGYHFKRLGDLEGEINKCKESHISREEFRMHVEGFREEQRATNNKVDTLGNKLDRKMDMVFNKIDELKKG
ncbi:MAG: hypothetical protein QME32_00335 [Endomicrobiia bacterium]|nr:hypothetical protein [Endomicrobiia bacterium]